MNTYIYTDNSKKEKLFEVEAKGILEADKEFKKEMGYDASKHPYMGCEIIFGDK